MVYRVLKYIGAYYVALGGADAIALTAGVGENNLKIRKMLLDGMAVLGVEASDQAYTTAGEELLLTTPQSKVQVWVVPTNEELAIARETARLV